MESLKNVFNKIYKKSVRNLKPKYGKKYFKLIVESESRIRLNGRDDA